MRDNEIVLPKEGDWRGWQEGNYVGLPVKEVEHATPIRIRR
jgi:hypothetical protein